MAQAMFIAWTCLTILASSANLVHGGTGVNWGTQASHPLPPNVVVGLLKDNGIKKVKLFDSDYDTVNSLAGTGIEVMLGIPNELLADLSQSLDSAKDWVKENLTEHLKSNGGVDIRYVAVGNEPFLKSYNGSFTKTTLPAMQNIQKAMKDAGVGDKIKVTTPLNADVYDTSTTKPSGGNFRSDIKDLMKQIVQFLHSNKAPFLVNIYPFLSLYQNPDFPVNYAFIGGGGQTIDDNGNHYDNAFDANYDTLVWTLKKYGYSDMKIVVGEVGWPTNGNVYANATMAKKFYDGLFNKLASKKGTPMRPNHDLEVYLFGLLDEDAKSIQPGFFERHWGIFSFDGQPKFPMDFSGHGYDKLPVAAKGVEYLNKEWCVFDEDNDDPNAEETLAGEINYACSNSDCSAITPGSSCTNLDTHDRASYAFNMYYQTNDQDDGACSFRGLGKVVNQNPSNGSCVFPIQLVVDSGTGGLNLANGASIATWILFSLFVLHMKIA